MYLARSVQLFGLCTLWCTALSSMYLLDKEKNLTERLFKEYDPNIRPIINKTKNIKIYLSVGMIALNNLDFKNQRVSVDIWTSVVWPDEYLKWNDADENVKYLYVNVKNVWTPIISVTGAQGKRNALINEDVAPTAVIFFTGYILVVTYNTFQTRCKVDISKYPFDIQTCEIHITPWNFDYCGVRIMYDKIVNMELFETNAQWIVHCTMKNDTFQLLNSKYEYHALQLTLQRRVIYHLLNDIAPVLFLSFLNPFVFLLPDSSGEKITMGISVFLSYAIFLSNIKTNLPENSDQLCLFNMYLTAMLFNSLLIMVLCLGLLSLYHNRHDDLAPYWMTQISCGTSRARVHPQNVKNKTDKKDILNDKNKLEDMDILEGNSKMDTTNKMTDLKTYADVHKSVCQIAFFLFFALTSIITVTTAILIFM